MSTSISIRPARSPEQRVARALAALPDRIVLLLFWTSITVSVPIMLNAFDPRIVVPLLAMVVAATWRLMPSRTPHSWPWVVSSLAILIGVLAWVLVHLPHASAYVVVTRDPGFLTLEGIWLSNNPAPDLPIGSAAGVADMVDGVFARSARSTEVGGSLHVQGAKLLPALLALTGWVGGDRAVLAANLLIGAVTLLALYGLARRVVGPVWALLPTVALAGSMPLGAFSRAAYTEPLVAALILGGLMMTWSAFETRAWWRHAIGAAMIGATALARIDGAATVIGLIAGLALAAAAPVGPVARRRLQKALLVAVPVSLAMVLMGYLDLRLHSPGYLADLKSQFQLLTVALIATALLGLLIALPRFWDPVRTAAVRHRNLVGGAGAALVGAIAAVLITRPLWDSPRLVPEGTNYANLIGALQQAEGLPVDPTRSYDDWSVLWITWYYGWPAVVLAFIGLALIAWRAFARRDPRYLLVLATVGAPSALFLWRVSITPDQIWAIRRLLAPTIPGFLLAATVTLALLWGTRRRVVRWLTAPLALAVGAFPFLTWGPMFDVAEHDGRYGELHDVCQALPDDRVVYIRHGGPSYLAGLRSVCEVDAIEVTDPPTADMLAEIRQAWGGTDLPIVAFTAENMPFADSLQPLRTTVTTTWPNTLSHRPNGSVVRESTVWVGVITADGIVVPVPTD